MPIFNNYSQYVIGCSYEQERIREEEEGGDEKQEKIQNLKIGDKIYFNGSNYKGKHFQEEIHSDKIFSSFLINFQGSSKYNAYDVMGESG